MDEDRPIRKFKNPAGVPTRLFMRLKNILTYPVSLGPLPIEVTLVTVFLVVLEAFLIVIPGSAGLIFAEPKRWVWLPWWIHALVGLAFLSGFIKKPALQQVKGISGLDPAFLRKKWVLRDKTSINNPILRWIVYLAFASWLATSYVWLRYIRPLGYFDLIVEGERGLITELLYTWFTYVIPTYWKTWLITAVLALLVLYLAQRRPFTGWFLTRTITLHIATCLLWFLLIISIGVWWYSVYRPARPF